MQDFSEFFESVTILIPSLDGINLPYTDIVFNQITTNAVIRFKNNRRLQGEIISSTTDSALEKDLLYFYFDPADESNLEMSNFLKWQNKIYKIIQIKRQHYLIPHVEILAELSLQNNIL